MYEYDTSRKFDEKAVVSSLELVESTKSLLRRYERFPGSKSGGLTRFNGRKPTRREGAPRFFLPARSLLELHTLAGNESRNFQRTSARHRSEGKGDKNRGMIHRFLIVRR